MSAYAHIFAWPIFRFPPWPVERWYTCRARGLRARLDAIAVVQHNTGLS